jgi:hypothetical protein
VLQNKPPPPGLVGRVPAAEIEALVVAALRSHLSASSVPNNDRDLLERHLERVTLTPNHLELRLGGMRWWFICPRSEKRPKRWGSVNFGALPKETVDTGRASMRACATNC